MDKARPVRKRRYHEYCLVLVRHGHGRYQLQHHAPQTVGPGNLLFIHPNEEHSYGTDRPGWDESFITGRGLLFEAWAASGLLGQGHERVMDKLPTNVQEEFVTIANTIIAEQDEGSLPIQEANLHRILAHACSETDAQDRWLHEAQQQLLEDVRAEHDLDWHARQLGLNYDQFRKRFREATGYAPGHWRLHRRLALVKDLLLKEESTLATIAKQSGFNDAAQLSRMFMQHCGISCGRFRQIHGLGRRGR